MVDDNLEDKEQPMDDQTNTDDYQVTRRKALAALGAGAGTVAGVGAFSGIVAAWDRFDVCFDGCEEVSMIVSESDLTYDPPAVAKVIVSTGTGLECRTVEFTAENATTVPAQYGNSPVVKYIVPAGEKILGVLEYNYSSDDRFDNPRWCVNANKNDCANTADTPDLMSAPCLPSDTKVCPESDLCDDTDNDPEDPETPEDPECVPCETGEDLLVKYEWSGGKFVLEGSDDNIEVTGHTTDEDGEPVEACFTTEYCEVDAVVKAGNAYESYEDESGTFCVTGIQKGDSITQAISNVQFFCEVPDDPSVGGS